MFFKALKQNLRVKTFVATSANALHIQIWTALIALLILKYLQLKATFGWSLSSLVAVPRMNLRLSRFLDVAQRAIHRAAAAAGTDPGGADLTTPNLDSIAQ